MKRIYLLSLLILFVIQCQPELWAAPYLGDFTEDDTVHFIWSTNAAAGQSITRSGPGTIHVYKDNTDSTEVTTGVTNDMDFDSLVGIHSCTIVLTDAFYATGADYTVVLKAATIDTKSVNAVLAHFSIQNRFMRGTNSAALASSIPANFDQSDWSATGTLENTNITEVNGAPISVASSIDSNVKFWADTTVTLSSVYNLPEVDAKAISDSTVAAVGVQANIGNLDAQVSNTSTHDATAVRTEMDSNSADLNAILTDTGTTLDDLLDTLVARLTAARAGYLDNLSAGAVALAATQTSHTAELNNPGQYQADVSGLNDLSAADVASELATYDGPTNAEMVARTLLAAEYATAATQTSHSAELNNPGQYQADVATELATYDGPTNAEMVARTLVAANYATSTSLATVDTVVDAIKAVTDLLPNAGALTSLAQATTALTNVIWTDAKAAFLDQSIAANATPTEVATELATYDGPTNTEMVARTLEADDYATSATAGGSTAPVLRGPGDIGIVTVGATVNVIFFTEQDNGDAVTAAPTTGTIQILKDGTTWHTSDDGYTVDNDINSYTGMHLVQVDTSDTGHSGFWAHGSRYIICVESLTVDSQTKNVPIASFKLEKAAIGPR